MKGNIPIPLSSFSVTLGRDAFPFFSLIKFLVEVVAMSGGLADIDVLGIAKKIGARNVIVKPFDLQTFLDTVQGVLQEQ